jgi:amino acid permease
MQTTSSIIRLTLTPSEPGPPSFWRYSWVSICSSGFQMLMSPQPSWTGFEITLMLLRVTLQQFCKASSSTATGIGFNHAVNSIAISLAIFPYIGVELVTVTSFEAANPAKLRWPTKNIAYVITLIYGLIVGALAANVEWFDSNLPQNYSQDLVNVTTAGLDILGHSPLANQTWARGTTFAPVIAVLEAGASYKPVASVLLGLLLYSALSCANVNLYVASRALYGLTRDLALDGDNVFERLFAHLNQITPTYRVPLWSIILSLILCASWLPFVKLGLNQQDVSLG